MCTRYVLLEEHYRAVLQRLGIAPPPLASRYNIAPGGFIPAVRVVRDRPAAEPAGLHWGLATPWARSPREKLVNTRAESLGSNGYLNRLLRSQRCVVPASGFYEWETIGRAKQPWLFRRADGEPFGIAGVWDDLRAPEGEAIPTCAVITTAPNELMRPIHERMPALLSLDECAAWLDPAANDSEKLLPLLRPAADGSLAAITVAPRMNSARIDDPSCIAPAPRMVGDTSTQLSLDIG